MSRQTKETIQELYEHIEKNKNALVIAEGTKDKKALQGIGFSRILTLNKPLFAVVEDIKESRVILLTDLDKKGKQIYGRLKNELSRRGVYVDDALRNMLFRTELRQVEGLASYLDRMQEKRKIRS